MKTILFTKIDNLPILIEMEGKNPLETSEEDIKKVTEDFERKIKSTQHFNPKDGKWTWNTLDMEEYTSSIDVDCVCHRIDFNDKENFSFHPNASKEENEKSRIESILFVKKLITDNIIDSTIFVNQKGITEFGEGEVIINNDLKDRFDINDLFEYISKEIDYDIKTYLERVEQSPKEESVEDITKRENNILIVKYSAEFHQEMLSKLSKGADNYAYQPTKEDILEYAKEKELEKKIKKDSLMIENLIEKEIDLFLSMLEKQGNNITDITEEEALHTLGLMFQTTIEQYKEGIDLTEEELINESQYRQIFYLLDLDKDQYLDKDKIVETINIKGKGNLKPLDKFKSILSDGLIGFVKEPNKHSYLKKTPQKMTSKDIGHQHHIS